MIENILGWLTLTLILSVILFKTKNSDVLKFLLAAFMLRAFLVILDNYYFSLPGGTADAKGYVVQAQVISEKHGLAILLNMFSDENNFFISRIISIFFTLTDKSEMMAQGISVALGTASVYLVYRLSLLLWNKYAAIKAAWIMSLHPSMVLFSALVLKEAYVTFFLLLTLIPTILFIRKLNDTKEIKLKNKRYYLLNNYTLLLLITSGFFLLKNIHGGIFAGFFILIFFLLFHLIQIEFNNLKKGRVSYLLVMMFIMVVLSLVLWSLELIKIPYLPGPGNITNLYDILLRKFNVGTISHYNGDYGSAFPTWTIPNNIIEFFPKILARILYFSYSPFPWDIKRYAHLFGLADSLIMIYLSVSAWRNRKLIWENPTSRFLLILLVTYLIIYGLGTSNFGTSIRHKTKFIFILICLAGPKLLNLRHSYNK